MPPPQIRKKKEKNVEENFKNVEEKMGAIFQNFLFYLQNNFQN